jgi:hypothetical protein
MFASQGRWLYCDDQPRVWFAMVELQASPHAPPKPFKEWTADQVMACMVEALSRRSEIKEDHRAAMRCDKQSSPLSCNDFRP